MEQELRSGLDLGWLAILKKKVGDRLQATSEGVFYMFSGSKIILLNFFENTRAPASALKSCMKYFSFLIFFF